MINLSQKYWSSPTYAFRSHLSKTLCLISTDKTKSAIREYSHVHVPIYLTHWWSKDDRGTITKIITTFFMICESNTTHFLCFPYKAQKMKCFLWNLNEILSTKQKEFFNFSAELKYCKIFWFNLNQALPPISWHWICTWILNQRRKKEKKKKKKGPMQ